MQCAHRGYISLFGLLYDSVPCIARALFELAAMVLVRSLQDVANAWEEAARKRNGVVLY